MQIYSFDKGFPCLHEIFCTLALARVLKIFQLRRSKCSTMSGRELQNPSKGRRQYLVTYSQADGQKFPEHHMKTLLYCIFAIINSCL